jgi:thiamine monophosphate kinase
VLVHRLLQILQRFHLVGGTIREAHPLTNSAALLSRRARTLVRSVSKPGQYLIGTSRLITVTPVFALQSRNLL